ncbi:hypothetical protein Hypma_007028 [Hypsizygus marmoreus]|uniref:F-box domain-containing protein n=1 Tax=Hypsizygus marmoreus TaxID=39966 RepID=A0A369KCL8_HYPMA|nr:hypothetical protein Hypma_007028 [Hypsizygus marmoreus]
MTGHINNFSPEVMQEIFLHCSSFGASAVPSRRSAPLNIAWVCSSWRNLALSIPDLWAALEIGTVRGCVPDVAVLLHHWAKLSRDRPLSITYNLPGNNLANYRVLSAPLVPLTARLQHVHFRLEPQFYLSLLCGQPRIELPLLESLTLASHDALMLWVPPLGSVVNLCQCPLLRRVVLESIPHVHDAPSEAIFYRSIDMAVNINWSIVASLKIVEPRLCAASAIRILAQCTLLAECELSVGYNSVPGNAMPHAVLPHLTSVSVEAQPAPHDQGTSGVVSILNALTLPGLKTLVISAGWVLNEPVSATLLSLQQRSHFLLEHFSLSGSIDVIPLGMLFLAIPTLKTVSLHPYDQSIYRSLLLLLESPWPQNDKLLLPHLHSLELSAHALGIYANSSGKLQYHMVLDHDVIHHYRRLSNLRSPMLFAMLRKRFRGSPNSKDGIVQLKNVTLRTFRSSEEVGCGDDQGLQQAWIDDDDEFRALQSTVQALKQQGIIVQFPVELID